MRLPTTIAALLLLGSAAPPVRDCIKDPANMLGRANCGFDQDVARWTAAPGAIIARVVDDAGGGMLQAVADSNGSLTVIGPCVASQPVGEFRFSARLRTTGGTAYFCSLNAWQFADESCSRGQEPLGSGGLPPSADWQSANGSGTMSSGAKSIQLRPVCSGKPGFAVQFDDFVLARH